MKNKITKFLLITCLILFVLCMLVLKLDFNLNNMSLKVGAKVGGGELTMSDYYTLVQYMNMYKESILNEKYELAYSFIGSSYRNKVSYEEFLNNLPKNIDKMQVTNIDRITNSTFNISLDMSGETTNYSIIINDEMDKFEIFPDSFLDYQEVNKKEKQKGLQCILKDYTVNTTNCVANFELKNTSKKDIQISSSTLYTNLDDIVKDENLIEIKAGESKNISITYETDYAFPEKVILVRNIENSEKTIEYTFNLTK